VIVLEQQPFPQLDLVEELPIFPDLVEELFPLLGVGRGVVDNA